MSTDEVSDRQPPPEWSLTDEDIEFLVTYHPPTDETIPRFEAIKAATSHYLRAIRNVVPAGPRRTNAVNQALDLRMRCNLAISLAGGGR